MQSPDISLKFLSEKVLRAGSVMCCIETDKYHLETDIIETEKIDPHGNIYFFVPEPQAESIENAIIHLTYHHAEQACCIKIKARVDEKPTRLEIQYSSGSGQMRYLKIKARIISVEYIDEHTPLNKIKDALSALSKNVAVMFF